MTPNSKPDAHWLPTRATILDLSVNIVPLVILVAFSLLFLAANPWGWDPFTVFFTHFLTLVPLVLLAIVSYLAGMGIQREDAATAADEERTETEVADEE